jgi:short-subunit dehydrogenase
MPEKLNLGFVKDLMAAGPDVFFAMTAGGFISGTLITILSYLVIKKLLKKKQIIYNPIKELTTMSEKSFTVITGASKGLGKSMAHECAKKGFNLVLVALPGEDIQSYAKILQHEFRIETATIEADLTNQLELEQVSEWINQNFKVNNLVNNAGIGGTLPFDKASPQYVDSILLLNIRALVHLTHKLLPNIRQNAGGHILNIASMASFGPMPYKTVYPASKAFVYSFSRGLNAELRQHGITVSVAHPGGMATNPAVAERINQHGKLVKLTILSPEKTAEICIRQMMKNDTLIIPGIMNKLSWVFFKTCPVWLQLIIFRNSVQKEITTHKQVCYA